MYFSIFILPFLAEWVSAQAATPTPPPSSSNPQLVFTMANIIEVCGSTAVEYIALDTPNSLLPVDLTLGIQSTDGSLAQTLTQSAILANGSWTWSPVAVPAGQYIMVGIDTEGTIGLSGSSNPFNVRAEQGGSTACLLQTTAQQSSTGAGMSSTNTNTNTPTGVSNTPTHTSSPPPSSNTASNTVVPVTGSTGSHVSKGLIAGVSVAGALIFIAGLTALYWFFTSRRKNGTLIRSFPPAKERYDNDFGGAVSGIGVSSAARRWNGLDSVDEHTTGAAVLDVSRSGIQDSGSAEPKSVESDPLGRSFGYGYSGAGVSTVSSGLDEKGLSYPPNDLQLGLAYLPPAVPDDTGIVPIARSPSDSSTHSRSRARARTASGSTEHSSMQYLPYQPRGIPSPATPLTPGMTPQDPTRRSKGGTARKPVPSYAPEAVDYSRSPSAIASSQTHPVLYENTSIEYTSPEEGGEDRSSYIDPFSSRPPSSSDLHGNDMFPHSVTASSTASGVGGVSYTDPTTLLAQHLSHKSSFGESKPAQHVLIPDPPQAPERSVSPPVGVPISRR